MEKEDFINYTQILKNVSREEATKYWEEDEEERGLHQGDLFVLALLKKRFDGTPITEEEFANELQILKNN